MKNELKLTARVTERKGFYELRLPTDFKAKEQEIMKFCSEKRGGFIFLHIRPPKKKRSTGPGSQGNHFNGHVTTISEWTGYTHDEVKTHLKSVAVSWGYPQEEDEEGSKRFDLRGYPIGISEADCSVGECTILIEVAHWFAAQGGIELIEE